MTRPLLWLNGELMDLADGRIPIEDRGYQFADGLYEVIRFENGRPLMLREHLERWKASAEELLIDMPGTLDSREALVRELVDRSGFSFATVYGQLTRGVAPRNHVFPSASTPPTEIWIVKPWKPWAEELYETGVSLFSQPDERWTRCNIKSISLLPNVLAKEKAKRAGGFEALLYREDGTVTECSAANAYCVCGGVVRTHPLSNRILPGIARMMILDVARQIGVPVQEEAATLDEFRAADEVFISSTTMDLMPVTQIDGQDIGTGEVGPVSQRLLAAARDRVAELTGTAEAVRDYA
ncbi:MAG: D-amino acid aminotransferase [Sumerlaeia bacterium]